MPRRLPASAHEVGVSRGERARRPLAVDEAALRRPVRQDERLLLHEVVADLVVDLDVGAEDLLGCLADASHDDVPVGDGEVRRRVVVGPVLLAEGLVGAQPRVLAAVHGRPRAFAPS